MIDLGGKHVFIPNPVLMATPLANWTRSALESEVIQVQVRLLAWAVCMAFCDPLLKLACSDGIRFKLQMRV